MSNITKALDAHGVTQDLRVSFRGEWRFNDDPNPKTRAEVPLFQDLEGALRKSLAPGAGYRLSITSRFLELNDGRFVASRVTPLLIAVTHPHTSAGWTLSEDLPKGARACESCQGTGAGAGSDAAPSTTHQTMVEQFKAPQFAKMRDQRGGLIASGLQRIEGGQGPQQAEPCEVGPGLFQILFVGTVLDAEPARPPLVHIPDAWNYPVKLPGAGNPDAWRYPDNAAKRTLRLADELGADPNSPREHARHPWRVQCAACRGRGYA